MAPVDPQPPTGWRSAFELVSTFLMLCLAFALAWENRALLLVARPARRAVSVPHGSIPIAGEPTVGSTTARVAVVEYSDFQCPFCGQVARDLLPTLTHDYVDTGKVRIVFKNFPLSEHPLARGAAEAALCAGAQGQFWAMHQFLFEHQRDLASADLRHAAAQVGLDLSRYDECTRGHVAAHAVDVDVAEGKSLNFSGTPTFVFGTIQADGRLVASDAFAGAKSSDAFREILDRLLASVK